MSIDANIHFVFQNPIILTDFVKALIKSGWGSDIDGSISLLSPENFNFGDWQTVDNMQISDLLQWVTSIDAKAGGVGFLVVDQATGIGGPIMVSEDRYSLTWGISVNIPYIFQNRVLIDFSKCMSILWPAIDASKLVIKRIELYSE